MDDHRGLNVISYLVHQQGGRVEVPADWQRGHVTMAEGEDAEGRPVLIVTAEDGWLPGPHSERQDPPQVGG